MGMRLDSGWELAAVLYWHDHGMTVIRNTQKFPYKYRSRLYNFIPDFIVDGSYIEIKGRENQRTAAKFRDFPLPLIILRRAEMTPILKYVIEKYGADFHRLYA